MKKYIIGIDEVGRGCLAGPVVVCAALYPKGKKIVNKKLGNLKDSKQISVKLREAWVTHFKKVGIIFSLARVSPAVIDRVNISRAGNIAANRALGRILISANIEEKETDIFLDGGLYLDSKTASISRAKTVIKGDEKIKIISAASIIAKVKRDGYMKKISGRHPQYGLAVNKGYGTKTHILAIKAYGLSKIHRRSFTAKFI